MRRLRFLMLTTFYPPYSFGGDGIGIQRLSQGLVKRGHHVTVLHDADAYELLRDRSAPAPVARPVDDGVDIVTLRTKVPLASTLLTQQIGRPVVNGGRIRKLVRAGGYDVINFHNVSLLGGPGLFRMSSDAVTLYMAHEHWLVCPMHVLWRHGRELCTGKQCLRCSIAHRRPPQLWRYTGYLEREIQGVDSVIAMSEFSREKHREFGFEREMEVLPYFLPDADAAAAPRPAGPPPHGRPYFLFVGRLERIKGLDDVIPVFREFTDADLLIAGTGTHEDHLRELAKGMSNVVFLGRLDPASLSRFYAHAHASIVPSECFETFGIVLIESFRQGTPVIARRLGPFPEIVQSSGGGELFSDRQELLSAMHRIASDAAHRSALSNRAFRGYVERWSESVVVPKYLDIVRRAAERRGHRRVADALQTAEAQ